MKRFTSIVLCFVMAFCLMVTASAEDYDFSEISDYICTTVTTPTVGSIGGEWVIVGLARSGVKVPAGYYDTYYTNLEDYVKEKNGVLHSRKYTEYSRVILAVTAIGKDPRNVAGYNLLTALGDFEKTVWQGINGSIWALIALDCKNYEMPINKDAKVQATREMYIDYILKRQNSDGGWSLVANSPSEVDITAMALQALSKYRHMGKVNISIGNAINLLQKSQNNYGGFSLSEEATCESSAQVLTALCMLGIDYDSPEFTKNGKTVLDDVLSYYKGGGFSHVKNGEINQMATEQAFYSLVALERYKKGKTNLYTMTEEKNSVAEKLAAINFSLQQITKLTERVENN